MVSYGPWIQDPNFEQSASYSETETFDNRYLGDDGGGGYTDNAASSSPRQVVLGDLTLALAAAKGGHADVEGQPIDHGVEIGYVQETPTVVPPTYRSNWGAIYLRAKWRIAPSPSGYNYSPLNYVPLDPTAIGLQFEGSEPGPTNGYATGTIEGVSLIADSEIITRVGDSTATNSIVEEDLTGGWETDVVVQADGSPTKNVVHTIPGFTQATEPNAYPIQLGTTIDLTGLLADTDWSGSLWTETPTFVIPRKMPAGATDVDSGRVKYGWLLRRPWIAYSLKPPRYRWVYEDDSTPYRRTFPRDDSLAGGAARTFPRPRSVQASNRTSGGYL